MSSSQGVVQRSITIEQSEWEKLQEYPRSKQFVQVKLELDGKSYNAQLRHRGGHTLSYSKKSYEVRYGSSSGTTQILHWNAEYDDPSLMRNALSFHFFNQIGVYSPKTKHMELTWNGEPQGVYLEIESVDRNFFKARGLGWRSLIYAINDDANFSLIDPDTNETKSSLFNGYEQQLGDDSTQTRLVTFIRRVNRYESSNLAKLLSNRLDTNFYLKWLAGAVLTGNYDGFEQNYALYETPTYGRYRILPWDYEGTWGRNCYGRVCDSDLVDIRGYNVVTEKLLSFSKYRSRYKTLLLKLMDTAFTLDALTPAIESMHESIAEAIRGDYTRKHPYQVFAAEPSLMLRYIVERQEIIRNELEDWE
ncbi:CotH kinase family protein [Paenibacillus sp. MMS18-CY102]|uniref:CotH kinase family protein n=1 Tax=Paenibacillus sp. MMS18-CY102 TaxID=2682849 RepID=UPI0013665A70|nr:CotH kinase family protein [Paenibacillus sp. MMS18-CY102]MWC29002.1 spore coat protein CotH [Paenibacillus sp. MMS18-CY102]